MTIEGMVEPVGFGGERESASHADQSKNWVGVYIGALAGLLAIGGVGSGNATKDATQADIDAADTWAFFQAKNIRRQSLSLAADELELMLVMHPDLSPATLRQLRRKIDDYGQHARRLTSDPIQKDGVDELFEKARRLEAARDLARRRDPYFDRSQAILQIAIVLASVHLIVRGRWLLAGSGVLGVVGVLLMLNGFFLFVRLPMLG